MQLFIATRGAYIHVFEEIFEIKTPEKKIQIAPQKIESIILAAPSAISTDAISMALYHNIDIVVMNEFGGPVGRFWHSKYGSTAKIRRAQLEAYDTPVGMEIIRELLGEKLSNQAKLLRRLGRARKEKKAEKLFEAAKRITAVKRQVIKIDGEIDEYRGILMGHEGTASRIYFGALSNALPKKWQFKGRSRAPAQDYFNAFLNYAYGVLYSICEKSCVIAGLDPYVGFLHSDNYNKLSMVFDIIEPCRVWAEDVVVHLFSGRKIKDNMCDEVPLGYSLNKAGKMILMSKFNEYLDKVVTHRKRKLKRRDTVLHDCHQIANKLIKKNIRNTQIREI
ncbi:MAG: CRISPR-associated endonuclease Cas1 [Candidatus Zixiibacteriota bacterium]